MATTEYRVLARKYRPETFKDLIGQEALVQTLKNAIETNRLAQAYMLTGIRGVGKTTSARIIARAINCIGPDGKGNMTTNPCGVCEHCRAIAEDRHVDVREVNAASTRGIDNIRELIETTKYSPTSARYKVYIIDEVHMLTTEAFNALLKTLEEPPERVKFIFATTEIRKVPTTILSRCQRFDLRRVEPELLTEHFKNILQKENISAEDEALHLIAKAADGSVRDGLSLLDQAIVNGNGQVTTEQVRIMIGLADKFAVVSLFEQLMMGNIHETLKLFNEQYALGADPIVILNDLLDITHWVTRVKISADLAQDPSMPENERNKLTDLSKKLDVGSLSRTWQMLLKGISEVSIAPSAKQAAEMVLIRLAYATELPSPGDLVKKLQNTSVSVTTPTPSGAGIGTSNWGGVKAVSNGGIIGTGIPATQTVMFNDFQDVVAYALKEDPLFSYNLKRYVSLVSFEQGKICFYPHEELPNGFVSKMAKSLKEWTGNTWFVELSSTPGGKTLQEIAKENEQKLRQEAQDNPIVKAILLKFKPFYASIETIRPIKETIEQNGDEFSKEMDDNEESGREEE